MILVPGDDSWHGFESRSLEGFRRSAILNYSFPIPEGRYGFRRRARL
jgi:hypothetical protein